MNRNNSVQLGCVSGRSNTGNSVYGMPCRSAGVVKFINHSKKAARIAVKHGWHPGARYTNLRDARTFERIGFLDIDWKKYDFKRHISVAAETKPLVTVARDVERRTQLTRVLDEAYALLEHSAIVLIVPKPRSMSGELGQLIPDDFLLGYSVPTKYGGTRIAPEHFDRPVHLLGGRPDRQRELARHMRVFSLDCNRFTLDARFGDFFDGERFRPHPTGGYDRCITESVKNINSLWTDYRRAKWPH